MPSRIFPFNVNSWSFPPPLTQVLLSNICIQKLKNKPRGREHMLFLIFWNPSVSGWSWGGWVLIFFQSLNSTYVFVRNCKTFEDAFPNTWSLPGLVSPSAWAEMVKVLIFRSSEFEGNLEMFLYKCLFIYLWSGRGTERLGEREKIPRRLHAQCWA